MDLVLGKVNKCSFDDKTVQELETGAIEELKRRHIPMGCGTSDWDEVQVDCTCMELLGKATEHPKVSIGNLPALY